MPLSAWLRLPAARLRARLGRVPERPWIVPAAIGWLRRRIAPDWVIVELGCGRSTAWFAERADHLVGLEDNEYWHRRTAEQLGERGLNVESSEGQLKVDLRLKPIEAFPDEVASLPDRAFDLVVVDFLESPAVSRMDVLPHAREKVRPGGHLLLDDSDRPGYGGAFELLAGWRERRFVGVKDEWPQACETTIFRRPS